MAEPTRRGRLLIFLLVGGMGLFIILLYAGVVPWRPSGRCRAVFCDPYHWQVLCFGITFVCAGLSFVIPRHWKSVGVLCSLTLLVSFVAGLVGSFWAR
jgi:hypothetical protein